MCQKKTLLMDSKSFRFFKAAVCVSLLNYIGETFAGCYSLRDLADRKKIKGRGKSEHTHGKR